MNEKTEVRLVFCGWIFRTASSLLYVTSSLRAGDTIGLLAALLFFYGLCLLHPLPREPAAGLRRLRAAVGQDRQRLPVVLEMLVIMQINRRNPGLAILHGRRGLKPARRMDGAILLP
jgi:hypothetical protein